MTELQKLIELELDNKYREGLIDGNNHANKTVRINLQTIQANNNNDKLTDAEYRKFASGVVEIILDMVTENE